MMGISEQELRVIDSPAFQRLRMIKQLGFSEFSFPGASHSRYTHSLGAFHLAGKAFDSIFKDYPFSKEEKKHDYRQVLRLAALLHDIGHGPLSHSTEEVMPCLDDLGIQIYGDQKKDGRTKRKANHEDYTIKFIMDSHLTKILSETFDNFDPYHIACLIDMDLEDRDRFFFDKGLNFRFIFSQLVSSEVDVDRMDYLLRDAYFCGTSYGKVELSWLLENFKYHIDSENVHLALDRRSIYTFDDFLLSRYHMYLMIYFHHKSIIYEKMLYQYLKSEDCDYRLPSDIEKYLSCTDFSLYENMKSSANPWAQRITQRRCFKVIFENHVVSNSHCTEQVNTILKDAGINTILANSQSHLSNYREKHSKTATIYVIDPYNHHGLPVPIESCTEIFQKYEGARIIERVYVAPEKMKEAQALVKKSLGAF